MLPDTRFVDRPPRTACQDKTMTDSPSMTRARSSPSSTATSSASTAAKRAVAIALRNRWQRRSLRPNCCATR